jgi:hypothetical protein
MPITMRISRWCSSARRNKYDTAERLEAIALGMRYREV